MERAHAAVASAPPLQLDDPSTLISGLKIVPEFVSVDEEQQLLRFVADSPWDETLKRRTQQYGYKFDHRSQQVKGFLGPLPLPLQGVTQRLVERGLYPWMPDQVIINEYHPGINPHIDKVHCFDSVVGSIGLGSSCIMEFRLCAAPFELVHVFFPRRTAVILEGDARYAWTHGIAAVEADTWRGAVYRRKTRVSVTWRRVLKREHAETRATDKSTTDDSPY